MDQWYYVREGQQAGPVEATRLVQLLATGEVRRDELVWKDGMADWVASGSPPPAEIDKSPLPAAGSSGWWRRGI